MLGTILVGNMFRSGSYIGIIIVCVIVGATVVWGIFNRKKVFSFIDTIYYKYFIKEQPPEQKQEQPEPPEQQ